MSKYYTKVHVHYKDGSIAKKVKVSLSINEILSGGVTSFFFTDNNGVAIIGHNSRGTAKVIVNGTVKGKIHVPGETVVFI